MFVFIHIPKTAGTSLGNLFDFSTERRIFWDYDADYKYARDVQPVIRDNIGFISSYFKVIYGHFYNEKYASILPDATFLTCVRHPVKRIVSQYYHVALEGRNWQSDHIREGKMDIVAFAETGNIVNAQELHLEGRELSDYGQIFITEHLEKSLHVFQQKFNFEFKVGLPRVNTDSDRREGMKGEIEGLAIADVTEKHRTELFNLSRQDVDIYRASVDLLTHDRKVYG